MKAKEELQQLKKEYESLNNKLKELTEDELKQVTGGEDYNEYQNEFNDTTHNLIEGSSSSH